MLSEISQSEKGIPCDFTHLWNLTNKLTNKKNGGRFEDGGKVVRAKPTCSCSQLGHQADHLKNRVNSKGNTTLYEVWKPKMAEDV